MSFMSNDRTYYIRVQLKSIIRQKRDVDGFGSFNENPDLYIAAEVEKKDENQMFTVGDGEMYGMYLNAPLREGESYDVFIGTGSKAGEDVVVVWSNPVSVVTPRPPGMPSLIIKIVPVVVVIFLVVLVTFGVIIYRRRSSSKRPDGEHHPRLPVTNPGYAEDDESARSKPELNEYAVIDDKLIRIADLATYVKQKKENRTDNFFTEFETLPSNKLHPWTVAEKPENKTKNRYGNIIPYDSSRVVLEKINGDPHSDYINASYIDGYKSPKKFIASHGPNKASVVDFWRMVWQENVPTIVMLTPLVEHDKFLKCLVFHVCSIHFMCPASMCMWSRGNYTTPRVSWSEERNLVRKSWTPLKVNPVYLAATGYGPQSRKTFCAGMIFPPVHLNELLSTSSRRAGVNTGTFYNWSRELRQNVYSGASDPNLQSLFQSRFNELRMGWC
ncbi:hypothetical protein BSL78_03830 [Apostichopus japonicus]|uniref:Tyrosine-protein phosphatase domain-containing protein n=1 Tax=Stichopus japonicus TaxID=307972 RepID=A0A2G8LG71_STIJA|nr:hypothetical protein BSL78_03830 [Apostichopus japonicus]